MTETENTPTSSPHPYKPSSPRSFIASLAVAAVLAGTGGVAIGHAWGDQGATAPSTSATSSTQWVGPWSGWWGGSRDGRSGQQSGPSAGQQQGSWPGTSSGGSASTSSEATRAANSKELTGLVRISTTNAYDGSGAAGTGMVLTSAGEVVTNHHVVEGATAVTATVMSTGRTYTARVVGTDARADVAVLQLEDASGLDTVSTATAPAGVGDAVTAVGDAGGSSTAFTASPGTVSALNRAINTQAEGDVPAEHLTGLMELTSDVAAGDSGGPTYDSSGQVVGMTTAASEGGRSIDGFAVPIARVLTIADDLAAGTTGADYTYTRPPFLGIALADGRGTVVQQVYDGTPAATAGMAAGDRITRVGRASVSTLTGLRRAIAAYQPGQSVPITWRSSGSMTRTATVALASGPIA